jgi:hypothetical protein
MSNAEENLVTDAHSRTQMKKEVLDGPDMQTTIYLALFLF